VEQRFVLTPSLGQRIPHPRGVSAQVTHGQHRRGMCPEELVTHVIERDAHAPHKLATWIGGPVPVGIRIGEALSLDERPCQPGGDAMAI